MTYEKFGRTSARGRIRCEQGTSLRDRKHLFDELPDFKDEKAKVERKDDAASNGSV